MLLALLLAQLVRRGSQEVVEVAGVQLNFEEKEISVPVLTYDVCRYQPAEDVELSNYALASANLAVVLSASVQVDANSESVADACISIITLCPVHIGGHPKYCLESTCADAITVTGTAGENAGSFVDVKFRDKTLFSSRAAQFTKVSEEASISIHGTRIKTGPRFERLIGLAGNMAMGIGPSTIQLNSETLLDATGIALDATRLQNCHKVVGITYGESILSQRFWPSDCDNECSYQEGMQALSEISQESYENLLRLETKGNHYSIEEHLLCAIDMLWSTDCYENEDIFRHRIPRYVLRFWTVASLLLLALPFVLLAWYLFALPPTSAAAAKPLRKSQSGHFVERPWTRRLRRLSTVVRIIAELLIVIAGALAWYAYLWRRHHEDRFTFKDADRQQWLRQPAYWGMSIAAMVHVLTAIFVLPDEMRGEPRLFAPLYLGATVIVALNAKSLYYNYDVDTLDQIKNNHDFANEFGFALFMRTWSSVYVFLVLRLIRAYCFCFVPALNMIAARTFALPVAIATVYPLSYQRIYAYWILPLFLIYCFIHDRLIMAIVARCDCFYQYESNDHASEIFSRMSSAPSFEPAGGTLTKSSRPRPLRRSNCNRCWAAFSERIFFHRDVIPRTECDESEQNGNDLPSPVACNQLQSVELDQPISDHYDDDELMMKACAMASAALAASNNSIVVNDSQEEIAHEEIGDGDDLETGEDEEIANVVDISLPTRDVIEPIADPKDNATREQKQEDFSEALFCGALYGAV